MRITSTVLYIVYNFFEYRSGMVNLNTVNTKFHLIQSFMDFLPDSYHFMFKMHS